MQEKLENKDSIYQKTQQRSHMWKFIFLPDVSPIVNVLFVGQCTL